jgi:hypothetical protein
VKNLRSSTEKYTNLPEGARVGYAYVPIQTASPDNLYSMEDGLRAGTIFPELDLPLGVYEVMPGDTIVDDYEPSVRPTVMREMMQTKNLAGAGTESLLGRNGGYAELSQTLANSAKFDDSAAALMEMLNNDLIEKDSCVRRNESSAKTEVQSRMDRDRMDREKTRRDRDFEKAKRSDANLPRPDKQTRTDRFTAEKTKRYDEEYTIPAIIFKKSGCLI